MAKAKGLAPGQVALAWLLHQDPHIVPIPGTKRRSYLEENAGAAQVELSAAELQTLGEALGAGAVAGPRYTEAQFRTIDR
jgi:aryl-alcohol dehydrogenase-like predicted oxidoreductase